VKEAQNAKTINVKVALIGPHAPSGRGNTKPDIDDHLGCADNDCQINGRMRKYSFNFCFTVSNLRRMILTDKLIHSVRTQASFPGCDYPSSNWHDKTVRVIPQ
jgi:hypothetical protein